MKDDNIQFLWSMVCVDVDPQQIVDLWISMRGFAFASRDYKILTGKTTKKKQTITKTTSRKYLYS